MEWIKASILLCVVLLYLNDNPCEAVKYQPNWPSLDSRPLPSWFDDVKLGIFMHWGVFSVPSYQSSLFQYYWQTQHIKSYVEFMERNYRPGFTYADFAPMFKAEFFDPEKWAELFQVAGAKYVVFTSKHVDGFSNWHTKYNFNWNSVDVGPKRDIVGDLATAVRSKTDLRFGLYHCLTEWNNPLYLRDRANKFKTRDFMKFKLWPEMYELVNNYKPEIIWSDCNWVASESYFNSTEFVAWLYNDSPVKDTVVINDRWASDTMCRHGGYWNCKDRFNPLKLMKRKWENAMTIDRTAWEYRRDATLSDIMDMDELLQIMAETISCGGNLLVDIGPTAYGRIPVIMEERLRQMGSWLKVNGDAIYGSKPWKYQKDTVNHNVWYTSKNSTTGLIVYAIVLNWPEGDSLTLGAPAPTTSTTVSMLGYPQPFKWSKAPQQGMVIHIPAIPFYAMPCEWAWVFRFTNLG